MDFAAYGHKVDKFIGRGLPFAVKYRGEMVDLLNFSDCTYNYQLFLLILLCVNRF